MLIDLLFLEISGVWRKSCHTRWWELCRLFHVTWLRHLRLPSQCWLYLGDYWTIQCSSPTWLCVFWTWKT